MLIAITITNDRRKRLPALLVNESDTLGIYFQDDLDHDGKEPYPRAELEQMQATLLSMAAKVNRQSLLILNEGDCSLLMQAISAELGCADFPERDEPVLLGLEVELNARGVATAA